MQRKLVIFGFAALLIAGGIYSLRNRDLNFELAKALIGDPLPDDEMYPPSPSDMPACTSTPLPELRAKYEAILLKLGVPVEACLKPGLSEDQLHELEERYAVKFSNDIKDLYKWHNGTTDEVSIDVFPLGKFLPLDTSLEIKHRPRTSNRDPRVSQFMDEMLAFRRSWIEIIADGSGNGYYFDPTRIDHSSSFFYHAHDDVPYDFYPCVGNWILSIIDEFEKGNLEYADGRVRLIRFGTYDDEVEQVNRYGRHVR